MIRINLAKRKQAVSGGGASSEKASGLSALGGLSKISINADQIKALPVRKFVVPIIVAIVATYVQDGIKVDDMQKVEAALAKLTAERTQLAATANKLKGYEAVKKSMEADQATMRSKIDTIQKLIADRTNPPKLLRSLASAIPKDVWLAEFKAGEKDVSFKGFSLDFNQIADFVKNLNESAYFTDLSIRNTQQSKDEVGLDVASFELSARRR